MPPCVREEHFSSPQLLLNKRAQQGEIKDVSHGCLMDREASNSDWSVKTKDEGASGGLIAYQHWRIYATHCSVPSVVVVVGGCGDETRNC